MEKKEFFASLCRQVKACSLKRAMGLAESNGYNSNIVAAIIERSDCSLLYMWMLLEKTPHVLPIINVVVKSKNFKEVSFKQLLWLFSKIKQEGSESRFCTYDTLEIIDERKILNKFSFEELLHLSEIANYPDPVVKNIGRKKSWQELDLKAALRILDRTDSSSVATIVINRKDCSLERALEIFHKRRYPEENFEAIIARKDFKLDLIFAQMEKPLWGEIEDVIMQNVYSIISRKDCSITLAYELLERARNYDHESFSGATMALIQKNNLPFAKALEFMKGIECHKEAIISFESRKDFTLEKRVELIQTMEECIPAIYESGNEPHYDTFDLERVIEKGDWLSPTLKELLIFNRRLNLCSPLRIISERADWKILSFAEAVKLAAETGNQVRVKCLIIRDKECSLSEALTLARFDKAVEDIYDANLLSAIIHKGIASLEESLEFLKHSNDPLWTVATLVEQTVVPLEEMVKLFRDGFSNLANLCSAISKSQDWKTIPLEKAFDFLQEKYMYKEPLMVIVGREDWQALPFQTAYDLLSKINWSGYYYIVIPSLTAKPDCPLKTALELINLLDQKQDIRKALYPVTSRLDNPLEEALKLSQQAYYGSFGGIIIRQDWKDVSLDKVCQYIEQYQDHDLVVSLAERADWQTLSFKEAVERLLGLDEYYRFIYLGLIISNEKYSLEESLSIVKEHKYEHMLAHKIIRRSDCSLNLASEVFKKADFSSSMYNAMLSRDDWKNMSLFEAFEFAKNTSVGFYSVIIEREDWKALSLTKSLQFAEKSNYNDSVMISIASRKNW